MAEHIDIALERNTKDREILLSLKEILFSNKITSSHFLEILTNVVEKEAKDPSEFDVKTFMENANFEAFRGLSSEHLKSCIDFDLKQHNYTDRIVYKTPKTKENTEFVIWLIEKGFKASNWETPDIAKENNIELMSYYFDNVEKTIHMDTLAECVKNNHMEIYKFLLDELFNLRIIPANYFIIEKTIQTCFFKNRSDMFELLLIRFPIIVKSLVKKMYNTELDRVYYISHIDQTLLKILWNNDMKWSKEQAEIIKNKFMLDYTEGGSPTAN